MRNVDLENRVFVANLNRLATGVSLGREGYGHASVS